MVDVTDLAATRAAVKDLEGRLGPTDLLIASAGIGRKTAADTFSAEEVNAHIQVNLIGVVNAVDAVLAGMRERRRGHLVVLSSLASYRGMPFMAGYCASKAGVNALFDSLRLELRLRRRCDDGVSGLDSHPHDGAPEPSAGRGDGAGTGRGGDPAGHSRPPAVPRLSSAPGLAIAAAALSAATNQRLDGAATDASGETLAAGGMSRWNRCFAMSRPSPCGYLPDQVWSLEYDYVAEMTAAEYLQRMLEGWRRFGSRLFRPMCPSCRACQALRVRAAEFRPDRSQRRVRKANEGEVSLRIGRPTITRAKLELYDRYHAHQALIKGWPEHAPRDAGGYIDSFVDNPFPIEEWCYSIGNRLIGVGYVDHLPDPPADQPEPGKEGLSAIYFFYDPEERGRSPGTWNVLCLIDEAVRRGLPYVYLGFYVAGSPSMAYKPRFAPNEVRGTDGVWRAFRE